MVDEARQLNMLDNRHAQTAGRMPARPILSGLVVLTGCLLAACGGAAPPRFSASAGGAQVYVPAGEILMGSAASDPAAYAGESPIHPVFLKDFWIGRTEVTNAMCALCVSAGACRAPAKTTSYKRSAYYGNRDFADYPVIFVTWNDATAYCQWAGGQLPTEAQWEKAARGTDGRPYPWGTAGPGRDLLNYNVQVGDTTEVGRYPAGASPYGALDMAGNVWEWVEDWYQPAYFAHSPLRDPLGPDHGLGRVMKGGSWNVTAQTARVAVRGRRTPDYAYDNVGFRCVR